MSISLSPDVAQHPGMTIAPVEFLHLHRPESALVTAWTRLSEDRYMVTGRWPASSCDVAFDSLTLSSTVRQACLLIAHADRGVPLDHQTMMEKMDFAVSPGFRVPQNRPVSLVIDVSCRSTGARSLRTDFSLEYDQQVIAEASLSFSWISPSVYRRLRGQYLRPDWASIPITAAAPSSAPGCSDTSRIALSPGDRPGRWRLRTDTANATLYDHPVDHVPGLALIEACHQAAYAMPGARPPMPHRVTSVFHRYVEFDAPCWVEASQHPTHIQVTGTQRDQAVFDVRLEHDS